MADQLQHPDPAGRDAEDPFFVVYESEFVDGQIRSRNWRTDRSGISPGRPQNPGPVESRAPRDKLHPRLRIRLQEPDLAEHLELIVAFTDQPSVPRFPEPIPGEEPGSPRNELERARADALVRSIQEQRAPRYEQLEAELAAIASGIEFVERFWLINGVVVEAPLSAVEAIAESPSVQSIAPRFSGEAPPTESPISAGRAAIGSDPYYDLNLPTSRIGLLDTGVLAPHMLLAGRLGDLLDCVDGGTDCATGQHLTTSDVGSHGTASAAILAGNDTPIYGAAYRGVTHAIVDSMRIYTGPEKLDRRAAQRGFALCVNSLRKIVVAEMQGAEDDRGDLAIAAEQAFISGAVVVAANGNNPGEKTVCAPASAHRVIGVGAYLEDGNGQYEGQSSGPTQDDRIKPDVQGPTGTISAAGGYESATGPFGGTSGATPYVAGAAALLRDWNVAQPGGPTDPGQVCAQLILFGNRVSPFTPPAGLQNQPTKGAGHLKLRLDGVSWIGKVAVGNGEHVDVDLPVPAGMSKLVTAAIWWPETWQDGDVHNTITLTLVDPSAAMSAGATTPSSVFERCSYGGTTSMGTWKVRIHGAEVLIGPQTVYWAAFVPRSTVRHLLQKFLAIIVAPFRWLVNLLLGAGRRIVLRLTGGSRPRLH